MGVTTVRHQTEIEQVSSPGGGHVAELVTPAVPTGREQGYITYRLASITVFGCTCGEYSGGQARDAFNAHVTSAEFQGRT